jgi:hypothetical protein
MGQRSSNGHDIELRVSERSAGTRTCDTPETIPLPKPQLTRLVAAVAGHLRKALGCVSYGGPDAISTAIGHAQCVLLSWFGTPCVLAIAPSPRLRCAQAREEEAETL